MDRKMVIPGEFIVEGDIRLGEGVFKENNKVYSSVMGLIDLKEDYVRVIPIKGRYTPRVMDFVIGEIVDMDFSCWYADFGAGSTATITARDFFRESDGFQEDISKAMHTGDTVYAMIREISPRKRVFLSMREMGTRKLEGGRIIEVAPAKIPRIIGRKGSMISMIKNETGCRVLVGQNGLIWVDGEREKADFVVSLIERIERDAHTSGLTSKIKEIIEKER
ncbi:MAG: exosome complex RNA-binding protein Rrp4 [Candidatus Hydrothermarchaeaceae archaeon]